MLKYIRDEAHRFALSFHRKLRSKSMIKSILDDIPGIGPKRRDIIWKNFSSIDELRNSTIKDIQKRLKFSEKVIQKIVDRFKDSD